MIIGNGLLAQAFAPLYANDTQHLIFASGVSNSQETCSDAFSREHKLLTAAIDQKKTIVYFSTCSIEDPQLVDSQYVQHKLNMEELVLNAGKAAIFRLPQVVGHTQNQHTLTNFLFRQISTSSPFKVWQHARRNLIDIDDVVSVASCLLNELHAENSITNIANPSSIAIHELVQIFEELLDIRAYCDIVDAGASYAIDAGLAITAANQVGIVFDQNYVKNLIKKYYA